jgi:hypothetical protein
LEEECKYALFGVRYVKITFAVTTNVKVYELISFRQVTKPKV